MNLDMAKGLAAMALAAGCLLAPAVAHAQASPANGTSAETARTDPADESGQGQAQAAADASAQAPAGTAAEAATQDEAPAGESQAPQGDAANQADAADAVAAPAQPTPDQVAAKVKAAFEKEFPGIGLDDVRPTRFAGLYEVRIGTDLLYTNETVEYVLQGALIDARNKEDLTAKRIEELTRVAFDSLPLEAAIKQVKGDGSRKMAVFEDPNCGYCKRLHQTLEGMDNYTVYTLLFPILSPDSTKKARNIWCAADRVEAWRNQMLNNQAPPDAQCETPIEANLAFGRKLLVRGTPAIIFEDGSRVNGALPRESLEQRLDAATAAVAAKSTK